MNRAKFEEFWINIMKPIIEYKLEKNSNFRVMGELSVRSHLCRNMESWYNSLRDGVKREFMRKPKGNIDRHKICACIYQAIMEVKILKVKNGSMEKDMLVNAEVALLASCAVLSSFMLHDVKGMNTGFEHFLNKRKVPCFPKFSGSDSIDSYIVQTIKALCHNQRQKHLSVLYLSNIFCLLENYTKLVYRHTTQALNHRS